MRFLLTLVVVLIALSANAGSYVVTTNADSGAGSLRQAILDANSGACSVPCSVTFPASEGILTIEPETALPVITAFGVRITPNHAWTVEISGKKLTSGDGLHIRSNSVSIGGLIINGFPGSGIVIEDSVDVDVGYVIIGLDPTGTRAVPNQKDGVTITGGHDISVSSCTIGGNGGKGISATFVSNLNLGLNYIGKQYLPHGSGDIPLPNGGHGVYLQSVQNVLMVGYTIANNGLAGVAVVGGSSGVKIEDASIPTLIYANGRLPIDIGFDGPTEQNRPVLKVADVSNGFIRVQGEVRTLPNADVTVNVFASDVLNALGYADAKTALYAGKVHTDASGFASFELHFRPLTGDFVGQWISATATTATGGTSELSAPLRAIRNDQNYTVLTVDDSGPGSLRQAIVDANAGICSADFPCRILFNLSQTHTIHPLTPLPAIKRSGITIDGEATPRFIYDFTLKPRDVEINGSLSTPGPGLAIVSDGTPILGAGIRGVAINGFNGDGIRIDATAGTILNPVIANNFIGSDPNGNVAVPNSGAGIRVRGDVPFVHIGTYGSGNRIQGNLISGNGSHGVSLQSGFFELDTNAIGTDISMKQPIQNGGSGVYVVGLGQGHLERNTIAFNAQSGVSMASTNPMAFKAVIYNSINSNAGTAIELRDDVPAIASARQNPPELTSAIYDPATGVLTVTGSVTRVTGPLTGWTTILDFSMSTFPEAGGRGSAETTLSLNANMKDEGQGRFSFVATLSRIDPRGKRISATATPFIYQGFKGAPQDNLFGQGFEYGTTSEISKATPVTTAGCPADLPQLTGKFRWTAVAGATSYNVWLRNVPGVSHIIDPTSTLDPGKYEWFVEAIFDGCPSVKSEAAAFTIDRPRRRAVR